jgi:hypothetical protein
MRTVDTLTPAERGTVWRCPAFTVAFIDGQWCRLDYHQWIPLAEMPSGPFYELENPDFSDYRDSLLRYH